MKSPTILLTLAADIMAIRVVEFSSGEYNIQRIFFLALYHLIENSTTHIAIVVLQVSLIDTFSKKATNFDKIFTVDLTLTTVKAMVKISSIFCSLLRKYELYH